METQELVPDPAAEPEVTGKALTAVRAGENRVTSDDNAFPAVTEPQFHTLNIKG